MAENKAKRSVHLAQPSRPASTPNPAELMPVKAHAYHTIAELNGGFEKVIQDLRTLQSIGFFHSDSLGATLDLICGLRAQTNRELAGILHQRETANAGHFDGLCTGRGLPRLRIPDEPTTGNTSS